MGPSGDSEVTEHLPGRLGHLRRPANVHALSGDAGDSPLQHRAGNPAPLPGPPRSIVAGESHSDLQVRMSQPQGIEFVAKDDVSFGLDGEDEVDIPRPAQVGQVSDLGHQRRYPHAPGDEYDALRLGPGEREPARRRAHIEQAACVNGIVQVPRRQPALLPLDRQLAVRDAGGRRRDRVRPTHLLAVDHQRQVQVLAREKVERQARAGRRDEAERSDLGCLVEDRDDLQLPGPRFRHSRNRGRRSGPILMGVGAKLEVVGDQAVKEQNAEGGGEGDRPRGVGFDEHVEVQRRPPPRCRPAGAGPSIAPARVA